MAQASELPLPGGAARRPARRVLRPAVRADPADAARRLPRDRHPADLLAGPQPLPHQHADQALGLRRPTELRRRPAASGLHRRLGAHRLLRRRSPSSAASCSASAMALVLNAAFPGRSVLRSVMLIPWGDGAGYGRRPLGLDLRRQLRDAQRAAVRSRPDRPADRLARRRLGWAFNLVALVHVWNQAPLTALLILAALQSMPDNLHRAARIDGAGPSSASSRSRCPGCGRCCC